MKIEIKKVLELLSKVSPKATELYLKLLLEDKELPVFAIMDLMGPEAAQSSTSLWLSKLKDQGWVTFRKRGKFTFYKAVKPKDWKLQEEIDNEKHI